LFETTSTKYEFLKTDFTKVRFRSWSSKP